VTEVKDHGQADPDPVETVHADRRRVEEHPHQRRERKEDEAEQRQDECVEHCVDVTGARDPDDQEHQARRERRHQC
jgi:hypothetical protein